MDLTTIYLDTNLWNHLLDHGVNARGLLHDLDERGASLALSGQTLFELARTFQKNPTRALELFRYLKQYVDAGVTGAHDNMQQLAGEVRALRSGANAVVAFYGEAENEGLKAEVDKFAQGIVDGRAHEFINERKEFSELTRSGQQKHFENNQHIRDKLMAVSEEQLPTWLESESLELNSTVMLARQLKRVFDDIPDEAALFDAHRLLRIPQSRIAKAIVRADLYYNWRCANRGSIPRDLADDMYHVLNASYCSVYVTAEFGQAEYASLLLPNSVQVAIYNNRMPPGEWLVGLL